MRGAGEATGHAGHAARRAGHAPRVGGPPARQGEVLAWIGLAGIGAVALVVWVSEEAAGRLRSGRWPPVSAGEVAAAIVRLPSCIGDPRRAWPPAAAALMPGPVGVYGIALLFVVVLAGACLLVAAGVRRLGSFAGGVGGGIGPALASGRATARWRPVRRRASGARWATRADLRRLRVRRPGGGRVVLGRQGGVGRGLIATEARHSVLVLGPTQSGKTSGLAIPALLEWEGPVLATSVKGDLVAQTRAYRARQGTTWVFDPTSTAGAGPSSGWSPLQEATTWNGAQRMATWLVEATPSRVGLSEGAFWFSAAAKLLAPLLLAAASGGGTMADVVRWTNLQEGDEVERLLGNAGELEAGVAFFASAGRDERIKSSIYTTLETVLAPYEDPVVAAAADAHEIDPAKLVAGRHTLYLCGPAHEQARMQGVFASLVASVVSAAVERVQHSGRPLDPPLLLVLDEVANIAPLRDLDTLASTAAGMGIQLVTVCQDLAQLAARYGTERSRTIANNHRAKVVLSGVADVGTLDTLSGLAGEQAVREQTVTDDLRDGRRTTSSSVAYRRLAPADELRRIRPGEAVLVYGYLPPARLALRPWWTVADLRRRVAAEPPNPPPIAAGAPAL